MSTTRVVREAATKRTQPTGTITYKAPQIPGGIAHGDLPRSERNRAAAVQPQVKRRMAKTHPVPMGPIADMSYHRRAAPGYLVQDARGARHSRRRESA
jgi:hypothetical protein